MRTRKQSRSGFPIGTLAAMAIIWDIAALACLGLTTSVVVAGVELTPVLLVVLLLSFGIIGWYLCDNFIARRNLYAVFNLYERVISIKMRFFRLGVFVVLLVCAPLLLIFNISFGNGSNLSIESMISPAAFLVGVIVAAIGWIFTNYQSQRSARISNTLAAVRDHRYSGPISDVRSVLEDQVKHLDQSLELRGGPIPLSHFALQVDQLPNYQFFSGNRSRNLREHARLMLNHLNQIAYGVRSGQFDFGVVREVLRITYIRYAVRFHHLVAESTQAEPIGKTGIKIARTATYEHFLWLVHKLPKRSWDNASKADLIRPPKLT